MKRAEMFYIVCHRLKFDRSSFNDVISLCPLPLRWFNDTRLENQLHPIFSDVTVFPDRLYYFYECSIMPTDGCCSKKKTSVVINHRFPLITAQQQYLTGEIRQTFPSSLSQSEWENVNTVILGDIISTIWPVHVRCIHLVLRRCYQPGKSETEL